MRIVDLFCGIGGVAEAASQVRTGSPSRGPRVVAAIDIDRTVATVYRSNHAVDVDCRALESIRSIPEADCWWLSPPCQPYTRRGRGLAEHDSRSQALAHLITLIEQVRPAIVALENVPQFDGSTHHRQLSATLRAAGYTVRTDVLCPTQFGVPMRRKRFYLRARRDGAELSPITARGRVASLSRFLDGQAWKQDSLWLTAETIQKYQSAMDIVDADDASAITSCFTSAYGNSVVRAGSYVRCQRRGIVRRFAPHEISSLLGFRSQFQWCDQLSQRDQYRLLGNSLAIPVVRAVLEQLTVDR